MPNDSIRWREATNKRLEYNETMKIHPDGSFDLENGETVPFICPKDGWPIEYDDKILMVHCFRCGYIGSREEFSQEIHLIEYSES